jgi:hypothetical protein
LPRSMRRGHVPSERKWRRWFRGDEGDGQGPLRSEPSRLVGVHMWPPSGTHSAGTPTRARAPRWRAGGAGARRGPGKSARAGLPGRPQLGRGGRAGAGQGWAARGRGASLVGRASAGPGGKGEEGLGLLGYWASSSLLFSIFYSSNLYIKK